ncbi:MAG: amidohydrolase family protein [Verrucomicrobia bacterium]|nr:amidohydrolase family protein [Verrucomicrobiota bacterium]
MILRARFVCPIAQPPLGNGAVAVAGDRIAAMGGWPDLHTSYPGSTVDLGDVILLPGLVNAHCHLDYTDLAGLLTRPKAFPDWIKQIVIHKAGWGYSDYAQSWLQGAKMLLSSGTTTVADIEAVPELLPQVWEATPLRVISFLELMNVRSWSSAGQVVREAEQTLTALPAARGGVGLSPHAPYTTSPELLRRAAETARRRDWLLTTHVAESREEFDMFMHRRGALYDWMSGQRDVSQCGADSPVRHLARQGVLGRNFIAVHANYLADGDARLLAEHGVSVAHCPRSHGYFRHERFPIEPLLAEGVNVCLGTDSLASVERSRCEPMTLNLFSEMRALAANEPALSAESLVRMATVNGARALRRERELGVLAPEARADLIAIPFQGREADVYEAILNHKRDVSASLVGGQWAIPSAALA